MFPELNTIKGASPPPAWFAVQSACVRLSIGSFRHLGRVALGNFHLIARITLQAECGLK